MKGRPGHMSLSRSVSRAPLIFGFSFMMLMNKAGRYGQGSKWERRPRTGLHIHVSGWKVEVKPLRQASSGDLGLREGELQRTGELMPWLSRRPPSCVAVAGRAENGVCFGELN